VPPEGGPELGATAHATPIRQAPHRAAPIIGYLHAGARVVRAEHPYTREACEAGWYPIRPRGFVCLDEGATLDLDHPTLTTMAIQPDLNAALPYTYARTTRDGHLWSPANAQQRTIVTERAITSRSGAAIVGSWEATDPEGQTRRLAMLTNGRFLDVNDLEEATASTFVGVTLSESEKLPVGFIVKRGIAAWDIEGPTFERKRDLQYHELLRLTGRSRDVKGARYWEASDGLWVRHQDMTTIVERAEKPSFAQSGRRWVDVSVISGTLVAYEGNSPVYATLVSVGRDRVSDELPDAKVTKRGEFTVTAKYITGIQSDVHGFANRVEIHDAPWVIEMASGQSIHGAFWHNRFGIEHGDGNLQLSPADARWLFQWVTPELPQGWHGLLVHSKDTSTPAKEDFVPILPSVDKPEPTIINIHK
jgi:lipoprotein-anchoring transpeptidase ErfK/SrfK